MPEVKPFVDRSTIISIVPFEIHEAKPGLYPGKFDIPACEDYTKPTAYVIGVSDHLMSLGGRKQPVRTLTPSYEIARAIVADYLDGQMFADDGAHPGITWVQGEISSDLFMKMHVSDYNRIVQAQRRWFVRLCKETDALWAKLKNPRVIDDKAKYAAQFLKIPTPQWLQTETIGLQFVKCPACSTMNDPNNAVCTQCTCILNEDNYKKLKFAKSA